MKLQNIAIIPILFLYLFLALKLLLVDPLIWPDEAIYADVVNNLINEGRLGTDLWRGTIPGIENHAFWNPPIFFYLILIFFKIFGNSIITQRLLSVSFGVGLIIVFWFLTRLIFKNRSKYLSILSTGLLVLDPTFLRAVRISRPEIFILFFGFLSWFLLLKSLTVNLSNNKKSFYIIGAGFFASIAVLCHLIGGLFFVSFLVYLFFKINSSKLSNITMLSRFVAAFSLPLFIWLISVAPHLNVLFEQIKMAVVRKSIETPWLILLFRSQVEHNTAKLRYILFFAIGLSFLVNMIISKKTKHFLTAILLVISWVFVLQGKMFWYYVIPLPLTYLLAGVLLKKWRTSVGRYIIVGIIAILFLINIDIQYKKINQQYRNSSYKLFTDNVLAYIPNNQTVFLSTIPDIYYGFKAKNRKNTLYEFPVLISSPDNYYQLLNDSDYVVYNGSYETLVYDDLLVQYLDQNLLEVDKIGNAGGYQALVIKLKPRSERLAGPKL